MMGAPTHRDRRVHTALTDLSISIISQYFTIIIIDMDMIKYGIEQ